MRLFSLHLQWKALLPLRHDDFVRAPSTDGRLITFINFLSLHHKHFSPPLAVVWGDLFPHLRNLISKIDFFSSLARFLALLLLFVSWAQILHRKTFASRREFSIIREIPFNKFFILFSRSIFSENYPRMEVHLKILISANLIFLSLYLWFVILIATSSNRTILIALVSWVICKNVFLFVHQKIFSRNAINRIHCFHDEDFSLTNSRNNEGRWL